MDIKYNYIHKLLPIINQELTSTNDYDPHLPMKLYLAYIIEQNFFESRIFADYNIGNEELKIFQEFQRSYQTLIKNQQYTNTLESIQTLFELYQTARHIKTMLAKGGNMEDTMQAACDIIPDYNQNEILQALQSTDLSIEDIENILKALQKIESLPYLDLQKPSSIERILDKSTTTIIESMNNILNSWARNSNEESLIALWSFLDNNIGLNAAELGPIPKKERMPRDFTEADYINNAQELIMKLYRKIEEEQVIDTEIIREIENMAYKHPAIIAPVFVTMVKGIISEKGETKIDYEQLKDNLRTFVLKTSPLRYQEYSDLIDSISTPVDAVNIWRKIYKENVSREDTRLQAISVATLLLRKINTQPEIPLLIATTGSNETEHILYIDKAKALEMFKANDVLKPNIEYLVPKNGNKTKRERVASYLEPFGIPDGIRNELISKINEDDHKTASYQLLVAISELEKDKRDQLLTFLPANVWATIFIETLKDKNKIGIVKTYITNKESKELDEYLQLSREILAKENNTNTNWMTGYSSQYVEAAALALAVEYIKEYYEDVFKNARISYKISADPSQKTKGEDFLVFFKIEHDIYRTITCFYADGKTQNNSSPSKGSAPSNLAKSIGMQVKAYNSISDKEIRRFFTDPDIIDQALQIVQEHPEKFKTLNELSETKRENIIKYLLDGIEELVRRQENIDKDDSYERDLTYSNSFAVFFTEYYGGYSKSDQVQTLAMVLQEGNVLIDALISQSSYNGQLSVKLTEPDYFVRSGIYTILKSVSNIAKQITQKETNINLQQVRNRKKYEERDEYDR